VSNPRQRLRFAVEWSATAETIEYDVEDCGKVRVLRLAKVIELKAARGDDKNLAVLPVLRKLLEEINRG
jgi:hypothetical protein